MAIRIRKLNAEESSRLFPKRGQMDLSEYSSALSGLKPGDSAEVGLDTLTSRAMKRRIGQAAKQLGFSLRWAKEESTDSLRFQLREVRQSTIRTGRRGGRRKKSEQSA